MSEELYNRSWFFSAHQDVGLAAEAIKLARVFADRNFLTAVDPDHIWLKDWSEYAKANTRTRHLLDGLLLAHAFSPDAENGEVPGFAQGAEMAGRVEAFFLPSTALECQVFEHTTREGHEGYVIALSGYASDLMAVISWALPTVHLWYRSRDTTPTDAASLREFVAEYGPMKKAVEEMDDSIASYFRLWARKDGLLTAPTSILPTSRDGTPDGDAAFEEAESTHAACQTFLLAHEFSHILQDHFSLDEQPRAEPPDSFLSQFPDGVRQEVAADCAAFTLTMNSLIIRDGDSPSIPDFAALLKTPRSSRRSLLPGRRRRQESAERDRRTLRRCAVLASDACVSFFAVVDLLAAVARQYGDEASAARYDAVSARKDTVRGYVRWVREGLVHEWGSPMWHPEEDRQWADLDEHVEQLVTTLVPALGPASSPAPSPPAPDIPATFRNGGLRG